MISTGPVKSSEETHKWKTNTSKIEPKLYILADLLTEVWS